MPDAQPPVVPAQALYEHAACGLLLARTDGTILQANATFCGWLGYRADELVAKRRVQDLLTIGGRVFHQTHWAPLLQMQGSVAELKLDLIHRDGHTVPALINALRRRHGDTPCDELAVFIVSDRHKYERELLLARRNAETALASQRESQRALGLAEARLRLALESGRLHVWDVDPLTGQRRYDDSVAMLLGAPAPAPVTAEALDGAIAAEDREVAAQALQQALDPRSGVCRSVFRLNGRDGVQRVVSATGSAFFDDAGRLQQFVGVLQDITELTRQRAQAEQRALFAEQMVGIVSHDLRNPLSAILTSAHVLRRVRLPPRHAPVLERIVSATNRAQRLIDDLLDFTQARVGSGIRIVPRTVDLHALVAATVEELAAAFAGRSLQHRRHGDGDCVADGDRLSQLIGNLVANAMAYGAEEQPVTVTSGVERDTYSIAVHNFGAPIPLALRPRLFEPMARGAGDGADTRSVGLGLFIVREIVQAHGGRIDVESDADRGTVFTVVCPRQRAGSDPARAG